MNKIVCIEIVMFCLWNCLQFEMILEHNKVFLGIRVCVPFSLRILVITLVKYYYITFLKVKKLSCFFYKQYFTHFKLFARVFLLSFPPLVWKLLSFMTFINTHFYNICVHELHVGSINQSFVKLKKVKNLQKVMIYEKLLRWLHIFFIDSFLNINNYNINI